MNGTSEVTNVLDPENLSEQSHSRGRRLVNELVAGFLAGLLGGVLGLVVGAVVGGNLYGPSGGEAFAGMYGYEATGWAGLIVGVIVGGSTGVYWAGRFGSRTSSYLATFLTSVLAVLVGAGVLLATGGGINGDWLFNKHPRTLPILFLMTLLGGMLGFELTRRQKEPTVSGLDAASGQKDK